MSKKSSLLRMLGIGIATGMITGYPGLAHETSTPRYIPPVKQELVLERPAPAKIRGDELYKKIIEDGLNTGKFSPDKMINLIETGIHSAGGIPEHMDEGFVYQLINRESEWNPNAVSDEYAEGLGQITPQTWETYNPGVSYTKVRNPEENVKTIIRILNGHEKYFRENHPTWEKLSDEKKRAIQLAGYNWGEKHLRRIGWDLEGQTKRVPLETRIFVRDVLKGYDALKTKKI